MQTVFIIVISLLIILAIIDLIVGVSNDAVNFLVSAIGSKAAPLRVILIVSGLGVLIGATFSNGMMEIARSGIFRPELFTFSDVMIIFLAVMLTDIILLDIFNTLGFPTSTTVSIIFELMGASVAIALMLIYKNEQSYAQISEYINTASALKIIGGILFSVIVAFTIGAIVQYLSRLLFSFNLNKSYKTFGAVWGGLAITAITYFILIKGLKGSSFAGKGTDIYEYVSKHTSLILFYSFIAWSIIFAILQFFTRINILKIIVMVGTFALAMAFAGNDLVNFIGVPLAGLSSYQNWAESGFPSDNLFMSILSEPVSTPTLYLAIAGIVMVLTLWLSKKAKSVTKTSLDLSRQDEGQERFGSSVLSRGIVISSINFSKLINHITPKFYKKFSQKQFSKQKIVVSNETQSFDLIRASVNLMVSGVLISIGTSFKLPLSTTYVTFMVAMGTSLADQAWGRESAVYRISGVLAVIGGWFITAIVAFTVSFIFALALFFGSIYALAGLILLAVYSFYRSQTAHNRKNKAAQKRELEFISHTRSVQKECTFNIIEILSAVSDIYQRTIYAFRAEKTKKLKSVYLFQKEISAKSKSLKDNIYATIDGLKDNFIDIAPYYVQVLDSLREITHALHFVVKPTLDHLKNGHKIFSEAQFSDLDKVSEKLIALTNTIIDTVKKETYNEEYEFILSKQKDLLNYIAITEKNHIKRIKNKEVGTKNSILFLNLLSETKNITLYSVNLYKSQRDFLNPPKVALTEKN